jgi:hypothetical protein
MVKELPEKVATTPKTRIAILRRHPEAPRFHQRGEGSPPQRIRGSPAGSPIFSRLLQEAVDPVRVERTLLSAAFDFVRAMSRKPTTARHEREGHDFQSCHKTPMKDPPDLR